MWKVKATVVPVVIGALRDVTSKLGEWFQPVLGITSEISVHKNTIVPPCVHRIASFHHAFHAYLVGQNLRTKVFERTFS